MHDYTSSTVCKYAFTRESETTVRLLGALAGSRGLCRRRLLWSVRAPYSTASSPARLAYKFTTPNHTDSKARAPEGTRIYSCKTELSSPAAAAERGARFCARSCVHVCIWTQQKRRRDDGCSVSTEKLRACAPESDTGITRVPYQCAGHSPLSESSCADSYSRQHIIPCRRVRITFT